MKKRKGFRKIIINQQAWQYKVGKCYLVIYSPQEEKHVVSVLAVAPYFERGQWKKTEDGMVKPSAVSKYIQEVL